MFFFRAVSFSLFLLFFSSSILHADIRQWDFEEAEDYQFDQKKIELSGGLAKLLPVDPYQDAGSRSFEKGEFTLFTSADRGTLELAASPIQETPLPELPNPVGNRESGLSALWHFDEPSGVNVLDVAGRTVAKGNALEVVSGQTGFGFARLFDGEKSFIFVPHYETLRLDGSFSLEAWIRPVEVKRAKPQTIISRWQTVGAQRGFAVQISPEGKILFLVSPEGSTTVEHSGESILSEGVWQHVAVVFNGRDLRIYVNGVLDSRPLAFTGPVYTSNNPIYFGALVDNRVDQFFKGVIDETAFYRRALTETEILARYGNLQGLAGLWRFDERGGPITDHSGYGHNGTPLGDVQYEAEGRIGTGLSFNGKKSYVEMPASTRLAPADQMHLEAWIKPESLPGLGQNASVLSIYEAGASKESRGSELSLSLSGPDGALSAYAPKLQPGQIQGKTPLMPGVWQHVAVSWGKGKVRVYLNGILDAEGIYSGALDFSKSALRVGNDAKKLSPFHGVIDEAAVYRRVRTPQEVAWTAGAFIPGGIYTAESKDAGGISPWKSMSWDLPLDYGREHQGQETGLLHSYLMNDAEGAAISNQTGAITASPIGTYPVPGVFGKARWFSAKGYDKILSQKDFPALSTFSISLWFQFASGQPGLSDRLLSVGDGNPTVFRAADGKMRVQMQGAREIVSRTFLMDASWHHLVLTADGQTLFLYIDGRLEGNSPLSSATASQPLVLGNLKSSDTFQGALDEFLFYNYPLDRKVVIDHFLRGKMDVKMLVRSSDDSQFSNSPWRGPLGVRWAQDAGAYTAGLWHFEESVYKGEAGEVRDSGRFAGHGSVFGKLMRFPSGVYGSAVDFNGTSDFIRIPDSDGLHLKEYTVSAWIRPDQIAQGTQTILDKEYKGGAPVFSSFALELLEGNRLAARAGRPGGYIQVESSRDGEIAAGQWNFVAAVFNGKEIRLYINGKLVKSSDFHEVIPYDDGPLYFGRYGANDARFFSGQIDEVHLLNNAASESEMQTLFSLGSRANFFRPFKEEEPGVSAARYFQYQIHLESQLFFASPAVSRVNMLSNAYAADRPSVTLRNGISYAEITSFNERGGKNNRGSITYQLSPDGANWFFSNGRRWVAAAGASESNTGAQIQARIRDFAREVGIGSFYFRAFLNSPSGADLVELDSVSIEYLPNKLTLTAPNGGEALLTGIEHILRWTSAGETAKVNLEYSKDDFKNDFHSIAKNIPNEGSYPWKVPDDLSVGVKVRVLDALNPKIHDKSDLPFRITGKIEVLSPNWNERWEAGTSQQIVWKTLGSIQNVKIEYSTDDFIAAIFPVVDSLKNEGRYNWTVPDHVSKNMKIRVSDTRDLQVFDVSNDTFTAAGKITVLSPDLSSRWLVGSSQEIRWQTVGTLPLVHLDYQTSKSPEWVRIAENFKNIGAYMWQVPDEIDSQVQIRITDAGDKKTAADSAAFAITGGLRLLNPRGGEQWTAGTRRKIAWQTVGTIPTVDLEYKSSTEDAWRSLEKALANTGEYIWQVPDSVMGPVTVRVTDSHDQSVLAMHASASSIIPGFHLKSPNGGEDWKIGAEQNIVWDTTGNSPQVRLEYSKDRFKNHSHEIIASASNLGSYTWVVEDDPASEVWVRVSDASNPSAHSVSNAPFRIYGGFDIQIPKGGEKFEAGSLATFIWKTTGTIPKVRIEYSHDQFTKDARLIEASIDNEGKYTWKVPDDLGDGYQLRLRDVRDEKTESYSEGLFSVMGNFHLTYPAGGEDLIAGTLSKITWKGFGSTPIVRIDYSEDDFEKSFVTVADKAPNTGSYEWTVPNLIGRKFKLRIWDPAQPDSMDTMQVPVRIIGGFRLLEPNGGEIFYVGERVQIKWETAGTLPRVKLEFSSDHFTRDISVIADSYPNGGFYEWLVPNAPSAKYKVRISDPRDVTAYDISNSDFTIRSQFIVIDPNGGEAWPVGSKQTIRWQTSASVAQVKIEYSSNDFASAKVIEKAVPNTGEYKWTVPDDVSPQVKVKVSDVNDPEAFDLSDEPLRIQGILRLTSPVGGEVWKIGEQRAITWQTTGKVEGVRLDYSRDGFSSEAITIIESTPNTGFYNWVVPDDLSALTKVRVSDVSDETVQSVSPKVFEMIGGFTLLGPNGGEVWHATEKREINWLTAGTVEEVTLQYSTDDFKKDIQIIERGIMNTGRFEWEVPSALGDLYKVRVCDADSPQACDASDNIFTIRSPIQITYPQGGEKWMVGSNQELRWNSYGLVPRVSVYYSARPGEWKKMTEELSNEGHFLFRAPDAISDKVIFKVVNDDNVGLEDITREPVSILGSFELLTPNGGEKWAAGTTQKITWDTLGTVSNARLEYSSDDFKHDLRLIESSYTNTGSYLWTIPDNTGVSMKVRIADADHAASFDPSNDFFKIMPGITLASPNGGEKWIAGHTHKIIWKTAGKSDWVRVEYRSNEDKAPIEEASADNPDTVLGPAPKPVPAWKTIAERVPNGGQYEWKLPEISGKEFLVRVSDALDADAFDQSENFFEIKPELTLTYPIGGEHLKVGSDSEILWRTAGQVENVRLQYSTDGFMKDIRVIAEKISNSGKWIWQVPDHITADARVRVISAADASIESASTRPFKILSVFEFLEPSAFEHWTVGTEQEIKWNWKGSLETAKLEYSLNDFSSATVIQNAVPNKGSYLWTVPDLSHSLVRLRVSNPAHPESFALSQAFKVIPGFKVLSPNGSEKLQAGKRCLIEWQTIGTSSKVRLEYGLAEGEDWKWHVIEKVLRNQGKFEWRVPEALSAAVKIKVTDALDNEAFDQSDEPFKMIGVFRLLAPRGDEVLTVGNRAEIRWETTGKVPSVKLEYSADPNSSTSFKLIEGFWDNSGKYFWTIPDHVSEKVRIRVSDALEPDALAVSENPFKIRPVLTWDMPADAGRFIWAIDNVQTLKWKSSGTIAKVNLEYSTDRKNWKPIAAGVPNSGSYGWKVPDDTAQGVKLRISDASLPLVSDTSVMPITIAAQFEMLTPEKDFTLTVGSKHRIKWRTTGRVEKVWLELMTDGKSWGPLAGPMPDAGAFDWTVPDRISPEAKIRIFDGNNAVAQAVSSPFRIKGVLNLTSPLGGEVWETGSRRGITWKTEGTISFVKLEAVQDVLNQGAEGKRVMIAERLPNKGRFEWMVPDQIMDGLRVVVSDVSDPSVFSSSPEPFSIISALEVKSPRAGDVWTVGTGREIVWNTSGTVPEVALEYSRDGFYRDVNMIASPVPNTGAAMWTVADAISTSVRIRVLDARDSRAYALSPDFKIQGSLAFENPQPGSRWTVGSNQEVSWQTAGTISSIRLEYSRDDFKRDIHVIENVRENQNGFSWKIPDAISSTLKLRVMDEKDTSVFSISEPVKTVGALELKSPLGGESFQVLSTQKISWNTVGSIARVRLEYSKDDFNSDVHVLASDLKNQGSFDWIVPDDISAGIKIRIMDAQDFTVASASTAPFSVRGALVSTTETENVRWAVGSEQVLSWQTIGTIPNVRIEYSKDDFQSDVRPITDSAINTGTYLWKIPDDISHSVRVRISDSRNPVVFSVSPKPAAITGVLTWPKDKAARVWTVGEETALKWSTRGTIPFVQLEYSSGTSANPEDWKLISASIQNTGEYLWKVPDFIRENTFLRVSDTRDAVTSHISSPVAIMGRLEIISPRQGERWIVGTSHDVLWETSGTIPEVIIEYSTDGFKKDIRLAAEGTVSNSSRFTLQLPDVISQSTQIRVRDARFSKISSTSPFFSVVGNLEFKSSMKEAVWQIGRTELIEWQSVGTVPFVKLEYLPILDASDSEQGVVITSRAANTGSFKWKIPENIPANLRLKISNADDPLVFETGKPIHVLGVLELTAPLARQVLSVGRQQEILWKSAGSISDVKIEFSTDEFNQVIQPLAVTPNTGNYVWQIPDFISSNVSLRISDASDSRAFFTSQAFEIQGALNFLAPETGENLTVGLPVKIQWATAGTIPRVNLEYSRDEFRKDVQVISNSLENKGFYEWVVQDAISDKFRFRVTDASNSKVFALSEPLKVVGALKFKTLEQSAKYDVQSGQKLVWETSGSIQKVRLDYSRDGFSADIRTIADGLANTGSYDWTIPDMPGDGFKLRVSDASNGYVFAVTPAEFSIRGTLTLTLGTAEKRWTAGKTQDLTWTTVGTIPQVTLQYSKDDFQKDIHLVAENISNHGFFSWKAPDDISNTVRVRVYDVQYPEVSSVSGLHQIAGALSWLPFNGGSVFKVGDNRKVQWQTQGSIPVVRLEYQEVLADEKLSEDWKIVSGALENKGAFDWNVPNFIRERVVLRLSDARDGQTQSVSSVFKIQGDLKVLQPAGGERWITGASQDLIWETSGSVSSVILEYSVDAFKKSIKAIMPEPLANSGRFRWQIPDAISSQVQVRVRDASNPEASAVSRIFSVAGKLTFTQPVGPAVWQMGTSQKLIWKTDGTVPFVRIEMISHEEEAEKETGFILAQRLENKGEFAWTIPENAPAKVRFRVSSVEDTTVFSETQDPARILGILSWTAPSSKQIWPVGSTQELVWNSSGFIPNVRLEYSRDRFVSDIQTIYPLIPNTGSVKWQVPDAISAEVWLRVSDADYPSVASVSTVSSAIKGSLALTSLQDARPVQVSEKQEILWQTMGSVAFVNLEYSEDLFNSHKLTIAEKVPNNGRYVWNIPDAARKRLSVRVSDYLDPSVSAVSRAFTVHGGLALLSPRGGEIWKVDDAVSLSWQTLGNIPFVKMEYSVDEFASSQTVVARAENNGKFAWRIPAGVHQPIKIKISDAEDSQVFAQTLSAIKIQGVIDVLAPQGGEFWLAGSEQPVIWQSRGHVPYVNLEYSTDEFNTAVPVMMGMANEGRFNFTVPDIASESLQFKISDARDQSVAAVSKPLRVGGRLALISPAGGDILHVGTDEVIRWTTTGTIAKVKLDYSSDGFKNDARIIAEGLDNSGSYTWKIPDAISKDLQLRVSDTAHSDIYDVTPIPFKISGTLKLTAPGAGETWAVGSRKVLEWETQGTIPFVRIEYSKDNFYSSVPIHLNLRNTGKMEWQVPDFSGEAVQFRISDASDPEVSNTLAFKIGIKGVLSLSSPLGGEIWKAKTQRAISWNTVGTIKNISLSYYPAEEQQPVKIAESIANTGSYIWNLPDQTMRAVKVRVADSANPLSYSESSPFAIQGTLSLTAPQGGEIWMVGTRHPITWASAGNFEKVRLEYTADNFGTVAPIALSLPNEGKFMWRVPDAVSRSVQIRLSAAQEPSIVSESKPFEIRGALALLNPLGGEDWAVGNRHAITWETTGTVPQVRVEYSTDDFQNDIQLIAPALINKGVYYWDVPSVSAPQIKVRVIDSAHPDVFDVTANPVRIAGALRLTVPAQGENFRVGEKIKIRWTGTSNIANVKLEYSLDDFKTSELISNYIPNVGAFDWNIPDRISDNVRIRVSDAANVSVGSVSQIPFKIQGALKFISPKGAELWNVGSRQTLRWETLGRIPKVRLEYSSDQFKTAIPIAAGLDNLGVFEWAVADLQERFLQFRVSDASAPSVQAVTSGSVEIMSSLEMVSPAGGERWIVGDEKILRWRTLGGLPKVNLEYSKDNFNKNVVLIAADAPNLGSYSWKIPHDLGKEVRVRIKGAADSKVTAVSEFFVIDLNRVTWSVRDLRTNEHLIGLTLTDSAGKTQKNLSSPLVLEYPYGIYTTVWSKPGYGEFKNTWLSDKDLNFTVTMAPEQKILETVRFDFRYDKDRDLMSIKSWYEQDGLPVPAVVQSEVRIYQGSELVKTLVSSTPDTQGYFNMVWDTRQVAGDSRYTASASITTASGAMHASPVSYQLDIPVKEMKEPVLKQNISSIYLKPLNGAGAAAAGTPLDLLKQSPILAEPKAPSPQSVSPKIGKPAVPASQDTPVQRNSRFFENALTVPDEAALNETISIHFSGSEEAQPVLDLYDSNRKLVVRAQAMQETEKGKFTYLLPIKGLSFIPGKLVTVTVVDLNSGAFKSASIMIKSATVASGLDRQVGMLSAQDLLAELDRLISYVEQLQKSPKVTETALNHIEEGLLHLAGSLMQENPPSLVIDKFNTLTEDLARVLSGKGYDSGFLLNSSLSKSATSAELGSQIRLLQEALSMLRRLYLSTF